MPLQTRRSCETFGQNRKQIMKYAFLLVITAYLSTATLSFADKALDNVNSAIEAAWSFIDQGRATNYYTMTLIKREELELHEVEYRYNGLKRRIAVTFIEKKTVATKNGTTSCKAITLYMDDDGTIHESIGYGDRTFSNEYK